MIKALFLDRDGVINQVVKKYSRSYRTFIDDSPFKVSELVFTNGIEEFINQSKKIGYKIIIVTNQPSILKGKFSLLDYEQITTKICRHLDLERCDVLECFHKEDYSLPCNCRKPLPGLFLMAKGLHDIDLEHSIMIGDSWKDIQAAKYAGVGKTLYLKRKQDSTQFGNLKDEKEMHEKGIYPDYTFSNLFEVAEKIKEIEDS